MGNVVSLVVRRGRPPSSQPAYEAEKRSQALRLEAKILADLARIWPDAEEGGGNRLNQAENGDGRTWDRTRDLSRVKRALSR